MDKSGDVGTRAGVTSSGVSYETRQASTQWALKGGHMDIGLSDR